MVLGVGDTCSHPYSCWEGPRMYRKWVLRTGSLGWEEPWVPSSRTSSRVPSRSPSRMACRRCRFSLSQRPPSWESWWDLRRGSFMIQKATRGWGSGWKVSMAFGTGTRASSSILGTWGGGTRRPTHTSNDYQPQTDRSDPIGIINSLCHLQAASGVGNSLCSLQST